MQLLHAAVLLFLLVDLTPTAAQEIRISHQWAEQTDARDRAARVFVQEVEKRTRELSLRVYPSSSLNIKPSDLLVALQDGSVEMAIYPLVYAVSKVPEFSLVGLPALVPNVEAAHALKSSAIFLMLQSLAEDNGFKILAMLWNPGGFLGKQREISGPASVQGLRIRVSEPLFGVMLKDAGASVTTMPSNEILGALQSGSLDSVVTTYETMLSLKIYEVAKFATIGSPSVFMGFSPLVVSLSTWQKLTPEQQAIFEEAAAVADQYYESEQGNVERRTIATLQKAGVSVHRMTKEEYLAWLQAAQQTAWMEYTKVNPRARELLVALVRTFLDDVAEVK
jgi:TRAP-type C4-dicarboxylate transport system substrate-binding protein